MATERLSHCALLNSVDLLLNPVQIALVDNNKPSQLKEMIREVILSPVVNRTLVLKSDERSLPASHPLSGKVAIGDNVTAYVCRAGTCSLPITSPAELRAKINELLTAGDRGVIYRDAP
jgi:hypothetical protein